MFVLTPKNLAFLAILLCLGSCRSSFKVAGVHCSKNCDAGEFSIKGFPEKINSAGVVAKWDELETIDTYTAAVSESKHCEQPVFEKQDLSQSGFLISGLDDGDYFLCVTGNSLKGETVNATNSPLAFSSQHDYGVASIGGIPTTGVVSELSATVTGDGVIAYRYKLGLVDSTECSKSKGYSDDVDVDVLITDSLHDYSEKLILCVVAKNEFGVWQGYDAATSTVFSPARLSFTGVSDPSTSIESRFFKNTSGNSTVWTLAGNCNVELGNVTLTSYAIDATYSASCSSVGGGTFTIDLKWGSGSGSPYLSYVYGGWKLTVSQGSLSATTKIFKAATTHTNIVVITDATQLAAVNGNTSASSYYVLGRSFDLATEFAANTSLAGTLNGVFDGNDFTLSNFSRTTSNNGIFSGIGNGTIANLNIYGAQLNCSGGSCGILASSCSGSKFYFLKIEATLVCGNSFCGGVCALANTSSFEHIKFTGSVTGVGYVAGIVGANILSANTIKYAEVNATIIGSANYVAGLIGFKMDATTVSDSYFEGTLSGGGTYPGGLVGYTSGVANISRSFAYSSITNGYGPIIGRASTTSLTDAYYLLGSDCTGCSNSDGTALTAAEFKTTSSFPNFNFTTAPVIWKMGTTHPVLVWE